MSENAAAFERRLRQEIAAAFEAIVADAALIAAQDWTFVAGVAGATPAPKLHAANLRGAQDDASRPAAVLLRLEMPNQRTACNNAAITVKGTARFELFSGVDPALAASSINLRTLASMLREALARVDGIEIDGPDDLTIDQIEGDTEGRAILSQGWRIRQTLNGRLW